MKAPFRIAVALLVGLTAAPAFAQGVTSGVLAYPIPDANLPQTIAAGATWSSGVLNSGGYPKVSAGATSTQPGSITITRFLDPNGKTLIDSHTAAITAGTPASLLLVDGAPFGSFIVSFSNTGTATATITNAAVLLARQP